MGASRQLRWGGARLPVPFFSAFQPLSFSAGAKRLASPKADGESAVATQRTRRPLPPCVRHATSEERHARLSFSASQLARSASSWPRPLRGAAPFRPAGALRRRSRHLSVSQRRGALFSRISFPKSPSSRYLLRQEVYMIPVHRGVSLQVCSHSAQPSSVSTS